ncbi:MAG: aspartate aminotransferase family protein [Acutalibacteraceae bacterium]|nr:aspartate aminotransferase family protein [Acutalibacteraceae bacterium]
MSIVKEKDSKYIANTYARFPIVIESGKGSVLTDENGKEYIDLATGIAVNTFGAADSEWVNAVTKQLNKIQHTSNLYYTAPDTDLAKILCKRTGFKKVFFSNSGAEANECAIKAARKYAKENKGADYYTVVTLKNSFHGRTVTTLAATGQDVFHKDFLPLTGGFCYVEANNTEDLENAVKTHKIAAIMLECVQGEGGVMPLCKEFVKAAAEIAKKEDILLIIDEVQTGNGRTGKLYSYMNYGIMPDIITTAKGLGGGLPIGATMLGEKVQNIFTPGTHGSTFGGNPAACAGALSIINRIDEDLLNGVNKKSEYIFSALKGANGIKSVSGMGLMIGIETEKDAGDIINECIKNGVLVIKAKSKVRLLPALNIPDDLLEKAIEILKKACEV